MVEEGRGQDKPRCEKRKVGSKNMGSDKRGNEGDGEEMWKENNN